jgi:hypothetical protein
VIAQAKLPTQLRDDQLGEVEADAHGALGAASQGANRLWIAEPWSVVAHDHRTDLGGE